MKMEQVHVNHSKSDPVLHELNRLQNQLKEKDRELGVAYSEIKALKATGLLKFKALEELRNELEKSNKKVGVAETAVEQKNLEIKKLSDKKKEALAAQFAAEASLRRLHANQKDNGSLSIESIIAPLEANIKIYKNEIAALQDDNKALERLTKSKESALLEAEKTLKGAIERSLVVEEVQNHNFQLKRQIEIYQEENRLLDKTNRQKVVEVEKLSKTIEDLEETVLSGGAEANKMRDYQRRISELNKEKRTLDRELSRLTVSASRVASAVANEWKDENDKVMPIKQWFEERRLLQVETQRLKDKLAVSERTAKAEAQLKDKLKLRLKTLEEGLCFSVNPNVSPMTPKPESANFILGFLSNNSTPRSRIADSGEKESTEMNISTFHDDDVKTVPEKKTPISSDIEGTSESEDIVSGYLYDRLQREVISLRKACEVKQSTLYAKEEEIKMLTKKVEALAKRSKSQAFPKVKLQKHPEVSGEC